MGSLVEATVLGKQLITKTSKPSSAPRRRRSSGPSSHVGFTKYTVSRHLRYARPGTHQYIILAEADWDLFSNVRRLKSAQSASTVTEDETTGLSNVTPPEPEPSAAPEPSTPSHAPATSTPSLPPAMSTSSLPPATSTPSLPPATSTRPQSPKLSPSLTPKLSSPSNVPDPDRTTPVADLFRSYITNPIEGVGEPQPAAPVPEPPQENTRLDASLEFELTQNGDRGPPPKPLANVDNEPAWMKKKRTLSYFRGAPMLGCLSDVIQHWYDLEALLGFPEVVSFGEYLTHLHTYSQFLDPIRISVI